MGLYSDFILPHMLAYGMGGKHFRALRPTCVAQARGRVLELGFGAGHNLPHYTGDVDELVALEPSDVARKLAGKRVAAAPFPVEFAGLDGAQVPLDAASVDTVVSTWTLCTIPDRAAALAEVARVLKPGGKILFLEHGRAPDKGPEKWQRRIEPVWKHIAGGCHLHRPVSTLIEANGYQLVENGGHYAPKTPRWLGWMEFGEARPI